MSKRKLPQVIEILKEEHPTIAIKLDWLKAYFTQQQQVIIAFSGGLDSGFLASIAHQVLGKKAIAVTADTSSLPRKELGNAKLFAKEIGIHHQIIHYDELANENLRKNPKNRCYYCKQELASHLQQLKTQYPKATIIEGTNASELKGHRPGFEAVKEYQLETPLVEADLTKKEIRTIAQIMGLSIYDKPSSACLNSRIPYDTIITETKLNRIEQAETIIQSLTSIRQLRVREHARGELARIEIPPHKRDIFFNTDLLDRINHELKQLGFKFVTFDLEGYRTGSMN